MTAELNGQGTVHTHRFHPHRHTPYNDKGELKDCSAKWYCIVCKTWVAGKACHEPRKQTGKKVTMGSSTDEHGKQ